MVFYSLDLTDYVHIYIPYLDICILSKNYNTNHPKIELGCLIFFGDLIFQSFSSQLTEVA